MEDSEARMGEFSRVIAGFDAAAWKRWGWLLIAAILALTAITIGFAYVRGRFAAEETRGEIDASRADAGIASGRDAADTVGAAGTRERAIDQQTRENDDAIRNAPGADVPVDDGVHGTGIDSLCRRAAYRADPRCLQQPPS